VSYEKDMRERDIFFNTLFPHFKKDEKIYVLYADIACEAIDQFREFAPNRCINMGISEQNMIAVAAGLTLEGFKVYCYTILSFFLRATEQIRVLVNSMNLPIFMVGCGKDKGYLEDGYTHHAIEDIGIINQFKNIKIWDGGDFDKLVDETLKSKSPIYIRLGK
jgi:transketolase